MDRNNQLLADQYLDELIKPGWTVLENFLPHPLMNALRNELLKLAEAEAFHQAGIGRGNQFHIREEIRSDKVMWWNPDALSSVQQTFYSLIAALKSELNQNLFISLHEIELHYAIFPKGAFYARHLDQFQNTGDRQISMVLFLNPGWSPEDGGQLRIYTEDSFHDVQPEAGTLVLFQSGLVEHEVRTTQKQRLSLTGWFKTRPKSIT